MIHSIIHGKWFRTEEDIQNDTDALMTEIETNNVMRLKDES